jgi:hypothetical protein
MMTLWEPLRSTLGWSDQPKNGARVLTFSNIFKRYSQSVVLGLHYCPNVMGMAEDHQHITQSNQPTIPICNMIITFLSQVNSLRKLPKHLRSLKPADITMYHFFPLKLQFFKLLCSPSVLVKFVVILYFSPRANNALLQPWEIHLL